MNTQIGGFMSGREQPLPPLPDDLPPFPELALPQPVLPQGELIPQPFPPFRLRNVRAGCYLLRFSSSTSSLSVLDGTLRVEQHADGRTASGDLYQRRVIRICLPPMLPVLPGLPGRCSSILVPGPNPADGIPIFARGRYRYYLRVTRILEGFTIANSFTLGFQMWRFYSDTRTWTNEGDFTALMSWTTAPTGYPSSRNYLEGDVTNSSGVVIGRLTMGWVSEYLRRAVVEIDRVSASETPLDNGAGVTWRTLFDQVGWDVTVAESNTNVIEPSGESWSDAECHQAMLDWRDSADLDTQWRYHLLCVRRLDSTSRGIMYDAYGGDSNNVPREGAAESSHWQFTNDPVFPENNPWGSCVGLRFGQSAPAYFRTAVHEIGHAIMQFHPNVAAGNHIMQVTPQIAENAVPPVQFPNNIEWAFSAEDQRRLRHLPDVVVRPGTVLRFGQDVAPPYAGIPFSPLDVTAEVEGLEVQVSPLLETVPFGAPVRVSFRLVNKEPQPVPVPGRLSLKSGQVTGKVVDPTGTARGYSTIIRYLDETDMEMLGPNESRGDSLTLLRGPDGALFPSPGIHRVIVTLTWDADGCPVRISGEAAVMVTPPVNEDHAKAAFKVLTTPDALLTLAIGGDHLADGVEAVKVAIHNPVLSPHFAYIEAKRLAQRFGKRKANLKAAAELITDETVMSPAEIKKAAKLVKTEGADSAPGKNIAKTLKGKARTLDVSDEIKTMVDSL
jgi:hypothetical protein